MWTILSVLAFSLKESNLRKLFSQTSIYLGIVNCKFAISFYPGLIEISFWTHFEIGISIIKFQRSRAIPLM